MSSYTNDIFISYRRSSPDWVKWVRENFCRPLDTLLRPGYGDVKIFYDTQIETGNSWPQDLAHNLSRSRIMVPVLSRDYFQSEWCRLEIALMLQREKRLSLRTASKPSGLVIPVVIDDGAMFPAPIKEIQSFPLHDFANPYMRIDSPKQEALADALKQNVCEPIQRALETAPEFDPTWETTADKKFADTFRTIAKAQTEVPVPKLKVGP